MGLHKWTSSPQLHLKCYKELFLPLVLVMLAVVVLSFRTLEGLLCRATACCIPANPGDGWWCRVENFSFHRSPQAAVTELHFSVRVLCKGKGQRANTNAYRQLSWETGIPGRVDQHQILFFTFSFFFNHLLSNYVFYLGVSLHWLHSLGAGTTGTVTGAGDIQLISLHGGRGTRKQHFK